MYVAVMISMPNMLTGFLGFSVDYDTAEDYSLSSTPDSTLNIVVSCGCSVINKCCINLHFFIALAFHIHQIPAAFFATSVHRKAWMQICT